MTEVRTYTLDVPGAVLTYDVRESAETAEPPLLLFGSPMDASGFAALAERFPDRTVVTYDIRGAARSKRSATGESTPEIHGDDLHRLISALDVGPVDAFATSGGAINALALVAAHPEQVRTLVAHEPPLAAILPDGDRALAAVEDIRETYQRSGFGPGMAKFIAAVGYQGEFPADVSELPSPDPAAFGLPAEDDGSRDDVLLGQNLITCTHYVPDFDALRAAPTRIVLGAGADSDEEMAHRGAVAVAERLGTRVVTFPGGHGGFLGPEWGMGGGDPDGFAATLRDVLARKG